MRVHSSSNDYINVTAPFEAPIFRNTRQLCERDLHRPNYFTLTVERMLGKRCESIEKKRNTTKHVNFWNAAYARGKMLPVCTIALSIARPWNGLFKELNTTSFKVYVYV